MDKFGTVFAAISKVCMGWFETDFSISQTALKNLSARDESN